MARVHQPPTRGFSVRRTVRFGASKPKTAKGFLVRQPNHPPRPTLSRTGTQKAGATFWVPQRGQRLSGIATELFPSRAPTRRAIMVDLAVNPRKLALVNVGLQNVPTGTVPNPWPVGLTGSLSIRGHCQCLGLLDAICGAGYRNGPVAQDFPGGDVERHRLQTLRHHDARGDRICDSRIAAREVDRDRSGSRLALELGCGGDWVSASHRGWNQRDRQHPDRAHGQFAGSDCAAEVCSNCPALERRDRRRLDGKCNCRRTSRHRNAGRHRGRNQCVAYGDNAATCWSRIGELQRANDGLAPCNGRLD